MEVRREYRGISDQMLQTVQRERLPSRISVAQSGLTESVVVRMGGGALALGGTLEEVFEDDIPEPDDLSLVMFPDQRRHFSAGSSFTSAASLRQDSKLGGAGKRTGILREQAALICSFIERMVESLKPLLKSVIGLLLNED